MAQEIQRKLEETEVKTKELEERGVLIEKALRGEVSEGYCKEETELLQEFFDLMRERTELRRYERELLVRAQELELEDRHARLQQELRERLENGIHRKIKNFYLIIYFLSYSDEQKTKESLEIESSIIKEMMDIVAKRDSLIALLEEDRLRLSFKRNNFSITHSKNSRKHFCNFIFACVLFVLLYITFVVLVDFALLYLDIKQ